MPTRRESAALQSVLAEASSGLAEPKIHSPCETRRWRHSRRLSEEVFYTKPPHVRKLMQEEGHERGREVWGLDIWCQVYETWVRVFREIMGLNPAGFASIDVRYMNEVRCIKQLGGKRLPLEHAGE